ncbi:MAG: creatininase family protein [Lentisphaerae bacterium]|nr:creatininase family protein [Lentisphaerota bacterium]
MFTWKNTWKELADAGVKTAVAPIGSTEQHGTHLPLSTDTLITERIAEAIAEDLQAYLTPTIPIGQSAMWLEYPGSLSLSPDTLKAVMADMVESLVKSGFTTILFVSVHGGNEAVYRGFPEGLQKRYPGVTIFTAGYTVWVRETWVNIWRTALERAGLPELVHADEAETSLILSLRPELVGPHPTDCPLPKDRYPKGMTMRQTYPSGSMGHPSRATKEKGDQLWKELLPLILDDVRRQLREARQ